MIDIQNPIFPSFLQGHKCTKNSFKCVNDQCIHYTKICDGKMDCSDGSDEDLICKGN